ncbi:MAG: hypothetical protein QOE58_3055 [Actinomycetota bacterium]|jgi:hypothetical protein|nr:hypothetical protein [Actinomycetota bacterium]
MVGLPLALVMAGLLVVVGVISLVSGVETSLKPAERAATSYLQALKDQKYDTAFAMRCSPDLGGHDTFVQHWKSQQATGHGIAEFKIVGLNVRTINGRSSAQAQLEVRYADGFSDSQSLPLTKTGSTWNPCP